LVSTRCRADEPGSGTALIDKPSRRKIDVILDFVGLAIDDVFVAGYGIDYAERYRELPVIVAVVGADQPAIRT
jgi:hypoxanthine-guanine phosphoribosyltransferase